MEGRLQVQSFVSGDCYDENGNNNGSNLSTLHMGQYTISDTQNKFTVIGCDSYGYIRGKIGEKNYSAGCISSCDNLDDVTDGSCSGFGSCQTDIPKGLKELKSRPIALTEVKINLSATITETVPTSVDWAITGQGKCEEARNNQSYYACKENSDCYEPPDHSAEGYLCKCKDGYQGNPYISNDCKDIDECKLGNVTCHDQASCVNTEGNFTCECLKGYKGDGKVCIPNQLPVTKICLEELKKATNNFDEKRIIGRGGYGTVYKGFLIDSNPVAIKKSKIVDQSQIEQFINEVTVLSQINHRNVVKLLGCCLETQVPLLVYEYVTNGTLFEHIHNNDNAPTIPWETRLRIAAETAGVLSYLHSAAATQIIHRDVKSSNILLDDNFTAKVSDFGASKLVPMDVTQLSTMVQGTLGYLDPEYLHTSQLTEKSDVYSFGVVLVELMTGMKVVSFDRHEAERGLVMYFLFSLKGDSLFEILENSIVNDDNKEQMREVAELARRCLQVKGEERPTMKEVAMELEGLRRMNKHLWDNGEVNIEETEHLLSEASYACNYDDGGNSTAAYDSMKDHTPVALHGGR
ncbi:hypothetical protein Dsin_021967 [Dipteronia sinensis]|uniref:Uncharacterized protein n=1 Tax=Dipteronia sinensis TaxID=43782 RepID=A0AAE0E0Q2_9ROSI|nr:hypothetical protein Dsin_021967 [Dipteronia sinensis]